MLPPMRVLLDKPANRFPSPWELYALLLLAGAAVYIPLSYAVDWMPAIHSPLRYTGFACPLCGGTRAVTALMLGRYELAVRYNPLALVVFALLVWGALSWLFMVLPFKRRLVIDGSKNLRRAFWFAVAAVFVANWVYVAIAKMYEVPLNLN
jgi:hypothetical protein